MGKDLEGKELGRGITQRKDGSYSAKLTIADGKRKEKRFAKLSDARKWLKEQQRNVDSGLDLSRDYTVDEWFEEWFDTYKANTLALNTKRSYLNHFTKHISPMIGKFKLTKVKPIDCQKVINKMQKDNYSVGTIKECRKVMKCFFTSAEQECLISRSPCENVKIPKQEYSSDEQSIHISDEDLTVFLDYLEKSRYNLLIRFLLETGLRIGEALALTWEDINWEQNQIRINKSLKLDKSMGGLYVDTTKNKSSVRIIPMNENVRTILTEQKARLDTFKSKSNKWLYDTQKFGNLIFVSRHGTPEFVCAIDAELVNIVDKINADWQKKGTDRKFMRLSAHSMRHIFASRHINNGTNMTAVSKALGHAKLSTTLNIYTHVSDEFVMSEFSKMSGILPRVAKVSQSVAIGR